MAYPDFDLKALYNAMDEQRRARELSWAAAAREISRLHTTGPIGTSTIRGVRDRTVVEGDGVLQMLLWLDRAPESFIPGFEDAGAQRFRLPKPSPAQILRWDLKALHAALDAQRQARGLSWGEVAQEVGGFTAGMLTRMAKGGRTTVPAVMRIVQWLGKPAATFTRASDG